MHDNKQSDEHKVSQSNRETETAAEDTVSHAGELARSGDTEGLSQLIETGLTIDATNDRGDSLLLLACYYGREDCVRLLLQHGASVDQANHKGQRPLTGASFKGYLGVVKQLIAAGARLEEEDDSIKTPLMYAASFEHVAIVENLIEAGADINATTADGKTALDLARDNLAHSVVAILAPDDKDARQKADYDWTRM